MKGIYGVILLLAFLASAHGGELFSSVTPIPSSLLEPNEQYGYTAYVNTEVLTTNKIDMQLPLRTGGYLALTFQGGIFNNYAGYSWRDTGPSSSARTINISVYKDAIAGSIFTKQGIFEIQPLGLNRVRFVRLDTANFPTDSEPLAVFTPHKPDASGWLDLTSGNQAGPIQVDTILVYTPQARKEAGGDANVKVIAQAAIDVMNSSMHNSLVNVELNLVYTGEVTRNDSGDSISDLLWLRTSVEVDFLLNRHGADLAGLLVENLGDFCGRAYIMRNPGPGFRDYAVQVTDIDCAVGNLTVAHEFGHNMGLEHDPENSDALPSEASYPWSFGHYNDGQYRTVMSYDYHCNNGCPKYPYYSNPSVTFMGLSTGIKDSRDNARTLNLTSPVVAAFRNPPAEVIFFSDFEPDLIFINGFE